MYFFLPFKVDLKFGKTLNVREEPGWIYSYHSCVKDFISVHVQVTACKKMKSKTLRRKLYLNFQAKGPGHWQ